MTKLNDDTPKEPTEFLAAHTENYRKGIETYMKAFEEHTKMYVENIQRYHGAMETNIMQEVNKVDEKLKEFRSKAGAEEVRPKEEAILDMISTLLQQITNLLARLGGKDDSDKGQPSL
jgi:hypothetical protein